jgi:photosystem II stability/assembly factor-like uncharacterized protein
MDQGKTWKRVSNPELVVNDVMVDPRNSSRVLLATDRSGVLASDDGAQTLTASNHGYTHRYVSAILADNHDADTIYVGVVNDKEEGGVFVSRDGGQHWLQKSAGLGGRDVFTLDQASNGALIAGTNRGIFMLEFERVAPEQQHRQRNRFLGQRPEGWQKGLGGDEDRKPRGARCQGQRCGNHFPALVCRYFCRTAHQHQRGQDVDWRCGDG